MRIRIIVFASSDVFNSTTISSEFLPANDASGKNTASDTGLYLPT